RVTTGKSGITFVRFEQWLNNRFVVAAEIVVWLAPTGHVIAVMGNLRGADASIPSTPVIDGLEAFDALLEVAAAESMEIPRVDDAEIQRRTRAVYLPLGSELRLVWGIDIPEMHAADGRIAFVDALSGELLVLRDTTMKLDGANAWL